ncbi:MAG: hypothetical protein J4F35_00650 [Candidatus Latescibacteria bacterium]|nr:hypothetical protein [Candidatus Latescibacterota bacterium]
MYKILIIDRNPIFGATLAELLERSGYQVEVINQLADGLDHYQLNAPDLVLLGVEIDDPAPFVSASRSLDNTKVIAFLSRQRRPSDDLQEVLQALKGCPIFYKPFRTEDVLAAIATELVPHET